MRRYRLEVPNTVVPEMTLLCVELGVKLCSLQVTSRG